MSKTNSRVKKNYKKVSKEMEIILDNIPGLVFFKDTMNRFIRVNKKVADAYNLSKEEMVGKSLFELHSNKQAQAYWEDDLEVIRVGEPKLNIEEPWETDEGISWLNTNKIPYRDDDGKIQGIIGFSVDITERKLAEEQLKKSLETIEKIMNTLPIGILLVGTDKRVRSVNKFALNLLKIENEDEIIGKICHDHFCPSEDGCCPILDLKQNIDNSERILINSENKEIPILKSVIPILLNGENLLLEAFTDITEQKFRFLFETSPDPIFLMDLDGTVKDCNPEGEKKFGYTKEEIIGNPFMKFSWFLPETMPLVMKTFKTLISGEIPEPIELKQKRKDGSLLWVNVLFSFMTVGEEKLVQVITQDISKIKDTEKKLIDTMEKLKSSNAELEQFAYIISHDLQEPLRMVSSFTQLLQKRYHDKLDSDANDFINFAVDGTARMQRLINDLLIYSRVGTHRNSFKAIDMNIILKSVLANSHQLIEENNVTITLDPLPVIIADESQMIQLFQNLLSNAIKFNNNKSPLIHLSAEVLKNEWRFSVNDNGIGIGSKDLERIFIIFQRMHKSDKYPGRGLGLAICKRIIQRHGGKIWVESDQGKGSTFYISIPRERFSNYKSYSNHLK